MFFLYKKEGGERLMSINSFRRMSIAVSDLEKSRFFFSNILGLGVKNELIFSPDDAAALWGTDKRTIARCIYLQNKTQSTIIELVEFTPRPVLYMRDPYRPFDYGLFDIALRLENLELEYHEFKKNGFQFLGLPAVYSADWARVTVKEVIMISPDQLPVALIERLTNRIELHQRFGGFTDSAQVVPDLDEAVKFYHGWLGLPLLFNQALPGGMVNEILRVPQGVEIRMALLGEVGTPLVECLSYSSPGQSRPMFSRSPALGLFMISFETTSLVDMEESLKKSAIPFITGINEVRDGIYASIQSMMVQGPAGVQLRFFSPG